MAQRAVDRAGLDARLEGLKLRQTGFAAAARAEAAARLTASGLAHPRDEYWRYSNPAPLNEAVLPLEVPPAQPLFAAQNPLRLVFRNGHFDAAASDDLALSGVQITPLSIAEAADIHWAQTLYGQLEKAGQTPVPRPYAALNTAFASDGILLHVSANAARPIALIYAFDTADCDAILHHCMKIDAGVEITVLEQGSAGARGNILWEMDLGAGAAVHHLRVESGIGVAPHIAHIFARLDTEARLKSFTLAAKGRFLRHETVVTLQGDAASAHIAGANIGGAGAHHDDTVFITHQGRGCESRQVFKTVLAGGAVGVFQGKILVRQSAQKTDGYQISQSLLLDDSSQFLAKPELEIYADDVKCSHGSTSGAIDETALFYLQSRGVPRPEAEALLVQAFLAQAIEEIADPGLAGDMQALAATILAEG